MISRLDKDEANKLSQDDVPSEIHKSFPKRRYISPKVPAAKPRQFERDILIGNCLNLSRDWASEVQVY